MFGDSETDANAAKAASVPVILLENGYTEKIPMKFTIIIW